MPELMQLIEEALKYEQLYTVVYMYIKISQNN